MTDTLDLYDYAGEQGIKVYWFSMGSAESLSYLSPDGECYIAMDPWYMSTLTDERTKLAHELGHCCTGSFYNRWAAFDIREKHENRADKWAIQHLVSAEALDEAVASGCTEFWSLAEYFGVTEDFMRKAVCWYTHGNLAVDIFL